MKAVVAFCLLALVAVSSAKLHLNNLPEKLEESHYETLFHEFRNMYNKVYEHLDEFEYRFKVFRANVDFIRNYNAGSDDAKLAVNHMSDLSADEYRQRFLGSYSGVAAPEMHVKSGVANPKSVDWRQKGVVTPVKNQEQCGSCWAFSTTGSTEGAHAIATGNLVSLSEQNLVDCVTKSDGCNGGLMSFGFEYIINNGGVDTESSYPYTAQDGSCRFNKDNVGATLTSYVNVTSGDEDALADAVANNGPVSVAIDANHNEFMQYSSGVITIPSCSSSQLDHGVLVVGYGQTTFGKKYWIVKNSWSTEWGMEGYVWMRRDHNNMCGIATCASYPKA